MNWISWNAVCGESRTYWCGRGEKGAITSNPYLFVSIRQVDEATFTELKGQDC
jgi:hypothetical protein